ncbi:MAG: nucleotidyltransferase domain-containing protein [Ardenticatenaceae bacterium]|nr:nucleotidyltransferase domain-containing protein [Ardenticatenaceae bacterium]
MEQQNDVRVEREQRAAEIIARLKACVPKVLAEYPVEIAYVYGSVARATPLPSSDVDIALVLTESPLPYERLMLELDIQAALEDSCSLSNFDVRAINQAPLMVQGPIVQEGRLLYERDKDRRVAFEVLTRKKYFDYLPTAERMQRAFLNHIRRKGLSSGQSEDRDVHLEQHADLPE